MVALTGLQNIDAPLKPSTATLPAPATFDVRAVSLRMVVAGPGSPSLEPRRAAAWKSAWRFWIVSPLTLTGTIGTTEFLGTSAASAGAFADARGATARHCRCRCSISADVRRWWKNNRARFEGAVAAYRGKVAAAVRGSKAGAPARCEHTRTTDAEKALAGYEKQFWPPPRRACKKPASATCRSWKTRGAMWSHLKRRGRGRGARARGWQIATYKSMGGSFAGAGQTTAKQINQIQKNPHHEKSHVNQTISHRYFRTFAVWHRLVRHCCAGACLRQYQGPGGQQARIDGDLTAPEKSGGPACFGQRQHR